MAEKYDVMNDAMSLGIHRLWKDCFINRLGPADNTQLLDVAGGTGDIAFRFLNYVKQYHKKNCHVTVTDINPSMLEVGKSRSRILQHNPETISWQEGDILLLHAWKKIYKSYYKGNAEELPFKEQTFNAYTIAFGIRNCTHIDKVLREAFRVLQPGGRFMCLEFSHLENSAAQWYLVYKLNHLKY